MIPRPPVVAAGQAPAPPAHVADEVRSAVLAVSGVARMHGGRFGEVATYLPGRRVVGVRLDDAGTQVHVALWTSVPVSRAAPLIRRAVEAVTGPPVHVHIEDIDNIDDVPGLVPGPVDLEE